QESPAACHGTFRPVISSYCRPARRIGSARSMVPSPMWKRASPPRSKVENALACCSCFPAVACGCSQLPRLWQRVQSIIIAARPECGGVHLRRSNVRANALFKRLNTGLMTAVFVALAAIAFPSAAFAQVKVILSGGFTAAYKELLPEFEKSSGIKVTTTNGASQGNGPNTIGAQLRRGEPADVVIMNRAGLDDLIAEGKIAKGTEVDLARTLIAVAIRSGAPKPDISTVNALKQTLLRAKSVSV